MSQPLHVKIRIYDLLPPSNLSWMLNTLGTGVYHSSIQLPRRDASRLNDDASNQVEIAFGGHDVPSATGVFTLAAGTAADRMPGLREYLLLDAEEAFGPDWEKEFGDPQAAIERTAIPDQQRRKASSTSLSSIKLRQTRTPSSESTLTLAGPSYAQQMSAGSTASLPPTSKRDPSSSKGKEGSNLEPNAAESTEDPLERAWKIVDQMRSEEEWKGTKYSLLQRNCNSFTDELLYRLTGRRAPAWINRASWVATSVPCLVPAGWVDEVDEVAPDAPTPDQPVRSAPMGQQRRMVASR
ncbi:BZ3500_MvSof-1268-A1-R1_Chr1-3g02012 [Microbotryum saponariae]|uniref:BZ3500_MvSof-1268-A1-R1_Chr1-3g02012 protein n=1 Tax=Microbotryum saponariae TaxID=289078 RepID=A0A2X0KQJ3_9BASI|nr:BZ3500_MvSof-1268-A1-R1_Chr1-3g02012 [Microbotryum saponariae]SCZ95157.1 BZ3501_MvSof-1269-A2-R1_Chr1-3g01614 [Microbotryum saponariae]